MTRSRDLANLGDNTSTLENQGLTLINTTAFSAVASQSINDVFSATYTKYKLLIDFTNSINNGFQFRLRVGGSDLTGAEYNYQIDEVNNTSSSLGRTTNDTSWALGNIGTTTNMFDILIGQPQQTARTTITSFGQLTQNTIMYRLLTGITNVTTSYTGFTIYPAGGSMTGTVSVYGYKN